MSFWQENKTTSPRAHIAFTFVKMPIVEKRDSEYFRSNAFKDKLFGLQAGDETAFSELALEIFHYQSTHNRVYAEWLWHLNIKVEKVENWKLIPYLPIRFYKTHKITSGDFLAEATFKSSGTAKQTRSVHEVADLGFYHQNSRKIFENRIGKLCKQPVLAVLPHYLENGDSSLVEMCKHFMEVSGHPFNGFYLGKYRELLERLRQLDQQNIPVYLFGVSYALLDLGQENIAPFTNLKIIETGGMKGRRREMIREELHEALHKSFGAIEIYSEYGMTELLSQAYWDQVNGFMSPPWMHISFRDPRLPLERNFSRDSGCLNIVDLANVHSCAFLATDDVGKRTEKGFEVLGRLDESDIRGCNLLIAK